MKAKQVSIKSFLNLKLSPIVSNLGQKSYPLYYQITYNRKNTQLKSAFDIYLNDISEANSSQKNAIQQEIINLEKIIQIETKISPRAFSLSGIKNRHSFYLKSIDSIFQEILLQKIQRAVSQSNSEFQSMIKFDGFGVNVLVLYKAIKLLIENINKFFPDEFKTLFEAYKAFLKSHNKSAIIMDWMDDNFKNELKRDFLAYFDGNQKDSEKTYTIIDGIIADRIKFL